MYGRQAQAEKSKRQKRDAQLKAQAKSDKKRKRRRTPSPELADNSNTDASEAEAEAEAAALLQNGPLPAFLPTSILATEPAARPLELDLVATASTAKHKRFLPTKVKPAKDRTVGSKTVRVLQASSSILPPKSSAMSKRVREAWLSGQRKGSGSAAEKRRKVGGGFLRK